jgi:hypothetical protein
MAAARASGLCGIQSQPPDHAEVPPKTGAFSATTIFEPK